MQAPIPTNKQGVEPKRPSKPVNITHYCRLSPTISNSLFISWASEHGKVTMIEKSALAADALQKY